MEDWDDAWLEAEMARELAACDADAPAPEPEPEPEPEQDPAGGDGALDVLESYMRERSERYGQVERSLEQDIASVSEFARRVGAPQSAPELAASPSMEM